VVISARNTTIEGEVQCRDSRLAAAETCCSDDSALLPRRGECAPIVSLSEEHGHFYVAEMN